MRAISAFTEALVLRHLLQSPVSEVGFPLSSTVAEASNTNEGSKAEGKVGRDKGETLCIDLRHRWAWQ